MIKNDHFYLRVIKQSQTYAEKISNAGGCVKLFALEVGSILLESAKNAEGMKEHRQAVKCEARNPC